MKAPPTPLLVIGIVGIVFLATGSLYLSKPTPLPTESPAPPQVRVGLPVRLQIPRIGVDAAIEPVGVASDGTMEVPKGPTDIAWYAPGPRPGETGSAVLSGHYGWKNNIPAVFDDIDTLHKGDKIYVENADGVLTTFVVREFRTYDQDANAKNIFDSSDGKVHLNLITCEGTWDAVSKTYSGRLVVFADKE